VQSASRKCDDETPRFRAIRIESLTIERSRDRSLIAPPRRVVEMRRTEIFIVPRGKRDANKHGKPGELSDNSSEIAIRGGKRDGNIKLATADEDITVPHDPR